MYRLATLFTLLIMLFVCACDNADSLDLADDEFLVVSTGEQIKCSNYLYRFRSKDYDRLKIFLSPEPVKVDPIGLLNLDTAYKDTERIIIKIRKLAEDEVQPCTADVMWYNKVWVLEHQAL